MLAPKSSKRGSLLIVIVLIRYIPVVLTEIIVHEEFELPSFTFIVIVYVYSFHILFPYSSTSWDGA